MRILVVEDQNTESLPFRKNMVLALTELGFSEDEIFAPETLAECSNIVINEKPEIIVLDTRLQGFPDGRTWGALNFAESFIRPETSQIIIYSNDPGEIPKILRERGFVVRNDGAMVKLMPEYLVEQLQVILKDQLPRSAKA